MHSGGESTPTQSSGNSPGHTLPRVLEAVATKDRFAQRGPRGRHPHFLLRGLSFLNSLVLCRCSLVSQPWLTVILVPVLTDPIANVLGVGWGTLMATQHLTLPARTELLNLLFS